VFQGLASLWIFQVILWKNDYVNSHRRSQLLSDVLVEIPLPCRGKRKQI
jgi:hypothetical protein